MSKGQALVTAAPPSLSNPKVATHLGLIKEGLGDSISVIKGSGVPTASLGEELTGFAG